jgi:hypothetical protein
MLNTMVSRTAQVLIIGGMLLMGGNVAQGAGEAWSSQGTITWIQAGWSQDTMAVGHTAPLVNPANCPVKNDGYATDPADPGHSLFHTVALSAFMNKRNVQFLIAGCIFGKPKIIAVKIY